MNLLGEVLLAQDFEDPSKNLVESAIGLAKAFHSTLIPAHVLPDDIVDDKIRGLVEDAARSKLQATKKVIKYNGVTVKDPVIASGVPHVEITKAAIDSNANSILIGSGETKKGDKFQLGTTATRILQRSEKPVFVIKEGVLLDVKNIVCPVDFSRASKRALRNALTMARRFKASLTILTVCELQEATWYSLDSERRKENAQRLEWHKEDFENFLNQFNLADLDHKTLLETGKPAEVILSTIEKENADLLILGTNGKTGLNRLVLGSVMEKVVREVPCSFLALKAKDVISLSLESNIRDIEELYKLGIQFKEDGLFEEAIERLNECLRINNMHLPAYKALAEIYEKIDEPEQAQMFRAGAKQIMDRFWYNKIEEELRTRRSSD